jgi:ABC-type Fe3+ transport system substrate-binding protein
MGPAEAEAEWNRVLAAAKKEGKVSVALGDSALRETRPVWEAFQAKFGIELILSGGSGSQVSRRLLSERAVGIVDVDVVGIGVASVNSTLIPNQMVVPIAPLLFLPEVTDTSLWWEGKHWYADAQQRYLLLYALRPGDAGIAINTNLVNEDDLNSYWDVFDSRYDGKRVSGLMSLAQGGNTVGDMMLLVGRDWITRWVQSKPLFMAESDLAINYLISGRAGLGMFLSGELQTLDELRDKGAPVKRLIKTMVEGKSASGSGVVAIADAPHPNAQKLLLNWLMSREAQLLFQQSNSRYNSPREDIPKDMLAPDVQRTPGAHYTVPSQNPEYDKMVKEGTELVARLRREQKG